MIQAVPVVVVEIDGARQAWAAIPEAMQQAVELVRPVIDDLLAKFGGSPIDTAAVDLAARFDDVVSAVDWALGIEEALAAVDVEALGGLRASSGVDIGVLTARVSAMSGRTFWGGEALDSAARLAREAAPGNVGLGPAAVDLLLDNPREASWLGRLCERQGSATIVSRSDGDTDRSDGAMSSEHTRTNLPDFAGAFVGRVREFNAIAQAIEQTRRVALWGPAGAGKSRLGVEFARTWMRDGDPVRQQARVQAWFCDLSQATSVRAAAFQIARTTGVQIPTSEALAELDERLVTSFGERGRLLLVLDDVDALGADFDDAVSRWLDAAGDLYVLTTRQRRPRDRSRDGLGEDPSGPRAREAIAVDVLGLYSARALLRDLLERPLPMSAEPRDDAALAELVDRCGRLPLALELVARSSHHQPDPHAAGDDLADSQSPPADELERALLRSWQMLDDAQRGALEACTVFADSFSAEAAVSVIEASVESGRDARALVSVLCQFSLLRSSARPNRSERHVLLAPVRAFAAGRASDAFLADARRQHLSYFATWARSLKDGLEGGDDRLWLQKAQAELPNLYAAAASGRQVDLEKYVTILEAIGEVNVRIGPLGGFLERVDDVVEMTSCEETPRLELRARRMRAQAQLWAGHYAKAEVEYTRAHTLAVGPAVGVGDEMLAACMLSGAGFAMGMEGKEEEGLPMVRQGVEATCHSDAFVTIEVLTNAALIVRNRGHVDEATGYLHEALLRARRRDNAFSQASVLFFLGTILRHHHQRWDEAIRYLQEAYDLFSSIGDRRGLLVCYHDLAICYGATDQRERAERCYGEATALASTMGDREYAAVFWLGRGRSRFGRGEYAAAEPDLLEASLALENAGHVHLKVTTLVYLAATYAALERVSEARAYFDRADAIFEGTDITLEQPLFEVMFGYLEAALARAAMRNGDEAGAHELLEAAYARTTTGSRADEAALKPAVREASRLQSFLDECVERGELPAAASPHRSVLRVCEEMRWFGVDGAEPVDISRRGPIRRIFRALVQSRIDRPGETMTSDEILEAGWPDEVLTAQSASQRLYTTISRMRSLGLQDVLETFDGEYLIAPAYTPILVPRAD